MTQTAIVRQQAEARAKRDVLDRLRKPTLEMIEAGHGVFKDIYGRHGYVSGTQVHQIFVAMIEEFEK